jgi:hypothetical protein
LNIGAELFADVCAYSQADTHRTGTPEDAATIDWYSHLLRSDGATVTTEDWMFPRWVAEWSAEIDGEPIECLPILYQSIGTSRPHDVSCVATQHPAGLLTVKNQRVRSTATATPSDAVMQVPGMFARREASIRAQIIDARIIESRSANIRVSYGCQFETAEVLIATPLSGWFTCASERGTGLAVARWLAKTLAESGYRVALLATSGHELFNIGLEHHLAANPDRPASIIHVGASVAAASHQSHSATGFAANLFAMTNQNVELRALNALGFRPGTETVRWIGEATRWCTVGKPLLSVAGVSHWFHTPQDTPNTATSPDLLGRVGEAVLHDATAFQEASAATTD